MKNSLLAICLAVGSILPIHAQQGSLTKLKGSYVLSEEGVSQAGSLVTLASLTFAENGSVSGVQLIQTANSTARLDVQGVYNFDTAKVGTLTLNSSTTDAEGNAVNSAANYKILLEPDNELRGLRMNLGVYATARLVPAASGAWNGDYFFTEVAPQRSFARIVNLSFDSAGNADGRQFVQTLGVESELQFKGSFASAPDGFYTLTLSIPRADEDGGARTEDYIFVVTRNDIRMMRVDVRLAELITLTR